MRFVVCLMIILVHYIPLHPPSSIIYYPLEGGDFYCSGHVISRIILILDGCAVRSEHIANSGRVRSAQLR